MFNTILHVSAEPPLQTASFSYAYHRAELCGAFFNAVFLLALGLSIFLQSIERFINISSVENPVLIIIVGGIGLALNICSALVLQGAYPGQRGPMSLLISYT